LKLDITIMGSEEDKKKCDEAINKKKIKRNAYYDLYNNKHMFVKTFTQAQYENKNNVYTKMTETR